MPDIVFTQDDTAAYFAEEGVFESLDSFMEASNVDTSIYYDSIMQIARPLNDGKTYFVPRDYNKVTVFINKTFFANAGFTEETFPDELKDVITRLFIIRKNKLLNGLANKETENDNCFPEDIKIICDVYKRKTL